MMLSPVMIGFACIFIGGCLIILSGNPNRRGMWPTWGDIVSIAGIGMIGGGVVWLILTVLMSIF